MQITKFTDQVILRTEPSGATVRFTREHSDDTDCVSVFIPDQVMTVSELLDMAAAFKTTAAFLHAGVAFDATLTEEEHIAFAMSEAAGVI